MYFMYLAYVWYVKIHVEDCQWTYTNFNNSKKLIGETKYQDGVPKTEINYEAHIGTKFDYNEYSIIQRIQLLDLQMIKTDCEIER